MNGILPKAGKFFDRIAMAGQDPTFALGVQLLNGNPSGGFAAAATINQARARQEELAQRRAEAIEQAKAEARKQAFNNNLALAEQADRERRTDLMAEGQATNASLRQREARLRDADLSIKERRLQLDTEKQAEGLRRQSENILDVKSQISVANAQGRGFTSAAKESLAFLRDQKVQIAVGNPVDDFLNNPTLQGQLRFALARLANGGGVLSVQDVTMSDGSTVLDATGQLLNNISGRGKMSRGQVIRGHELLTAAYAANQQNVQDAANIARSGATTVGVDDNFLPLTTPGFDPDGDNTPRQGSKNAITIDESGNIVGQ